MTHRLLGRAYRKERGDTIAIWMIVLNTRRHDWVHDRSHTRGTQYWFALRRLLVRSLRALSFGPWTSSRPNLRVSDNQHARRRQGRCSKATVSPPKAGRPQRSEGVPRGADPRLSASSGEVRRLAVLPSFSTPTTPQLQVASREPQHQATLVQDTGRPGAWPTPHRRPHRSSS